MKYAIFIVALLVPLSLVCAGDWNLVRVSIPEDLTTLESAGFELFERGGDYWIGSLPEGSPLPPGGQILDAYLPEGGELYHLWLFSPSEGEKLQDRVTVIFHSDGEAIIQAHMDQLQTLPGIGADWARITLTPKPISYPSAMPPGLDEFSPYISDMVDQVSLIQYTEYFQSLEDFVTRNTFHDSCDAAAAWILAQFQSFGLEGYYDEFQISGQTNFNVVGEKVGLVYPNSVYFMVGHYDATAGQQFSPEPVAPGACDNASSIACLIEAARVLSIYNFEHTIRFVAFSGEEQGLYGSNDYVQDLQASSIDVAGCFNFDMISYTGLSTPPLPFASVYNDDPGSQLLANKVVEAAATFIPSELSGSAVYSPGSVASDHRYFWYAGWPAAYTLQQGMSYGFYHTVNDLVANNDPQYAMNVTKAGMAALADFAVPLGGGTDVSGGVSGNWSIEGSPYRVIGDVWIPQDATLTIDPGVYVLFDGHYKFEILENAALHSTGSVELPIIFKPLDFEGTWKGLRFLSASAASTLDHCRIRRGLADGMGEEARGGGIFLDNSSPILSYCLISQCTADSGGAIYLAGQSNPVISFSTFSGNQAAVAGGIFCDDSSPVISNSILWGNAAEEIVTSGSAFPQITYSNVEGGWTGEGNLDADPLFISAEDGDYHLQAEAGRYYYGLWIFDASDSPCIDAGDSGIAFSDEPEPNGDRVNMGVYAGTTQASRSMNDPHYAMGPVSGTWTNAENNPMFVFGSVEIPQNESLAIEPGVEVIFLSDYAFNILENATLVAVGTEADSIVFTAEDTVEGWNGLYFNTASDSTELRYCYLSYGNASASTDGGAIHLENCSPVIAHCLIENSQSTNGGGISIEGGSPEITACVIRGNEAVTKGGAIYITEANPTLTGNHIYDNSANDGGAIACYSTDAAITNNVMYDNTAAFNGGGIYIFSLNASTPVTVNNAFHQNSALSGGAIYNIGVSSPTVMNSILWENQGEQIYHAGGMEPLVTYSNVQGGYTGEGNIDSDPLFLSAAAHNYLLDDESPCIDTGNPDPAYDDPEDLQNPGFALWPSHGTVRNDMGAFGGGNPENWLGTRPEAEASPLPGEFSLMQNYPNPFNPSTTVGYTLPTAARVILTVYNVQGGKVMILEEGYREAGTHRISFDANNLPSGIYLAHLQASDFEAAMKMLLLK
jgi:hypothetical protein